MSYERLNIQDYVDKWDVEKVKHLENGIIANEEAIANLNVGSGGVQSDWSQNNENAADYVKNRTHFKVLTEHKILDNFEVYKRVDEEYGESWLTPTSQECDIDVTDIDIDTPASITINGVEKSVLGTVRLNPQGVPYGYEWIYDEDYVISYSHNYIYINGPEYKMEANDKFIVSMTIATPNYTPLNDKYIPDSVIRKGELTQSDWNCNDSQNVDYIKNRTHYDYYEADYDAGRCELPYVFTVNRDNASNYHWLGDEVFLVRNRLLNSESDWKYINEQYDDETGITTTQYQWKYEGNKNDINDYDVTINAEVIDNYPEYQVTFTSDREYLNLYKAILKTKTLDARFLPQTEGAIVVKNWATNDENDPAYIQNRTHYSYLDYGEKFVYRDEEDRQFSELPKTETIESYLSSSEVPGYWLGENKYLMNGKVIDAYSNWIYSGQTSEEEGYRDRFRYSVDDGDETFYIEANVSKSNWKTYYVTWTKFYGGWEGTFGKATTIYKALDKNYIPEGFAQEVDWLEESSYSPSYIKNKPFYELAEKREQIFSGTIPSSTYTISDVIITGGNGTKYFVTVNGNTELVEGYYSWESDERYRGFYTSQLQVSTHTSSGEPGGSTSFTIRNNLTAPYTISIVQVIRDYELKQLNEKFIPDTIMRQDGTLSWEQIMDQPFYDTTPSGKVTQLINKYYYSIGEHLETGSLNADNRYVKTWEDTASWEEGVQPKTINSSNYGNVLYLGNLSLASKVISNGEDTGENYVIWWSPTKDTNTLHVINDYLFEDEYYECKILEITPPTLKTLDDKFIPDTIARAPKAIFNDIEEAPTTSDFNTLLSILRESGILATE